MLIIIPKKKLLLICFYCLMFAVVFFLCQLISMENLLTSPLCWQKIMVQDPDCLECYCGWCGGSSNLVSCNSCKQLFCTNCIKRNLGEEFLSKVQTSGWQCCGCYPSVLQRLTLELDEAMGLEGVEVSSSNSDSDTSDSGIDTETRWAAFIKSTGYGMVLEDTALHLLLVYNLASVGEELPSSFLWKNLSIHIFFLLKVAQELPSLLFALLGTEILFKMLIPCLRSVDWLNNVVIFFLLNIMVLRVLLKNKCGN